MSDVTPATPTARYNTPKLWRVTEPTFVTVNIAPPKNGAAPRPMYVAELKDEIRSPLFAGYRSAIAASATGTNMAVAKPW